MFDLSSIKRRGDWRIALGASTIGAAALLVACGGGGGGYSAPGANDPPATAAAVTYSQGAISGFGSVIIGGVRFDDTNAKVEDEDGAMHDRTELKLGMMVQVDASAVDAAASSAKAERIRIGSEIMGPIGAITASSLTVLGQTVQVDANTVFDASLTGGLAALKVGDVVEVHGMLDKTSGTITATRIETRNPASINFFRLRGAVAALDKDKKTFMIGTQLVSYGGLAAADVPADLATGQIVRVRVQPNQVAGAWVAIKLSNGKRAPEGQRDAHVEGIVSDFTSSSAFEINGLKVDASSAKFEGDKTTLAKGSRVEVSGSIVAGVLVATKVEIDDKRIEMHREVELHGTIGTLDTKLKTFVLRGLTVSYGGTGVSFKGGTEADLAKTPAPRVEVKGVLSADRTRIEAKLVAFEI